MRRFITCTFKVKDEMGRACSTHGREEECVKCFGWKTRRKKTARNVGNVANVSDENAASIFWVELIHT
jgi:hypothetical protein